MMRKTRNKLSKFPKFIIRKLIRRKLNKNPNPAKIQTLLTLAECVTINNKMF